MEQENYQNASALVKEKGATKGPRDYHQKYFYNIITSYVLHNVNATCESCEAYKIDTLTKNVS